LSAWAVELGTTTRTLARDFQRQTGMTFSSYRQQMRLYAAVERLARGETATRIAYDLGFSSPSNFIVMFRRATGMTPRDYFLQCLRSPVSRSVASTG
jgi:AraC-like DNA-binding protein